MQDMMQDWDTDWKAGYGMQDVGCSLWDAECRVDVGMGCRNGMQGMGCRNGMLEWDAGMRCRIQAWDAGCGMWDAAQDAGLGCRTGMWGCRIQDLGYGVQLVACRIQGTMQDGNMGCRVPYVGWDILGCGM